MLYAEAARGLSVVACSPSAAEWGIRPGMPLAEARGLSGGAQTALITAPSAPATDRDALSGLALACHTCSPLVGLEPGDAPESLLLDITGCAPHFSDEQGLARRLINDLASHDCEARVAVADTIGAAWAAVHFATTPTELSVIIPQGQQTAFLRRLPIAALRLSPRIVETLHKLDLQTIGQLERLPRSTLPSRFGGELQQRLDQAWGISHELITPVPRPSPISAVWTLDDAVTGRETLELVARQLLRQVLTQLQPLRRGVRELQCAFTGERDTFSLTVRLVHSSLDERHLWGLLALEWDRREMSFRQPQALPLCLIDGVLQVKLTVVDAAPLRTRQQTLFEVEPGQKEQQAFRQLVERLSSRLGSGTVLKSRPVADPQPELACEFLTWEASSEMRGAVTDTPHETLLARSRPLRLLAVPEPLQVLATAPAGPPYRIWWNGQQLTITRLWGPERIATGWWRDQDIQRDYYRIETDRGHQLWIFCCLTTSAWFLHGSYE